VHSGLLGRLLLGQPLLIVSKILLHITTPERQPRSEVPRLACVSYPHSSRRRINCLT
jgi:hypothetical protein